MGRIAGNQTVRPRKSNDDYSTDPRWVRALLSKISLVDEVWEPAAGDGQIVRELQIHGYSVAQSDIQRGDDFLKSERRANTIITNPPFSLANEFIHHAIRQADDLVCLLLGWHLVAGGKHRFDTVFNIKRPTVVFAVVERMKVDQAASQFNHAWVVWDKRSRSEDTKLEWISIGQ